MNKMLNATIALMVLAASCVSTVQAEVIFGSVQNAVNSDDLVNPFPECYSNRGSRHRLEEHCPMKGSDLRGFDFYYTPMIWGTAESVNAALRWVRLVEGVLLELENSWSIRSHFLESLKAAGVFFYLSTDANEATDQYYPCPANSACYSDRRVADALPLGRLSNLNWNAIRHFLIHELTHAYHDLLLDGGFSNQCVLDAYANSVGRDGLHANTYAATNHKEYFAQIVSYAMRVSQGAYCTPQVDGESCPNGLIRVDHYTTSPVYPVQNKWLLAEYDPNGAGLFDAFFDPAGHLDFYGPHTPTETDPLTTPTVDLARRDCDTAVWWPE